MTERLEKRDYALDIYNTFARVKRKLISNIDGCVNFDDDFGVKDIIITDTQGNVLMYDNYTDDNNNGKSITVVNSKGERLMGRLISMEHDRITMTVNSKKIIVFNPVSYAEEDRFNCKLVVPSCPRCDLILTYTTDLVKWESQLILTFKSDDSIDILHIANVSNEGTIDYGECDINLIASNILITETQNQYVRALTAMNSNTANKNEDVDVIPLGLRNLFAKNHKMFINRYDVPKENYFKVYTVDNQSYNVYLGYKIFSPLLIPTSTLLAYKEYEVNNTKDTLFIGKNQVDETRPLSPFYITLVQTSLITYSFEENINTFGDTQFSMKFVNKSDKNENIIVKYYLRGRIPTRIISNWKYTIYNNYILFEGQLSHMKMKNNIYIAEDNQIFFSF